jgi:hypothetical protein
MEAGSFLLGTKVIRFGSAALGYTGEDGFEISVPASVHAHWQTPYVPKPKSSLSA